MATATRWLEELRYLSETVAVVDRFRQWGYTIYRTGYKPSSDQQWERLLLKIQTQAYENALRVTGATENDPNFQQIWSLFRLDARSDPALAGLDMYQLRLLYRKSEEGVAPMNADLRSHRFFRVADDQVLSDTDIFIVKCVAADFETVDNVSRDPQRVPQRYFGWMLMRAGQIVELWKDLEDRDLSELAPPTIGGSHLVVWENISY
ncbi:hypothetical protein BKA63DRAFT_420254 [Paraphoma chrysanthemicola]|nr:hypothetical protein BKA63DRAFT_420254 [Paraphoma chrysanthemicola]